MHWTKARSQRWLSRHRVLKLPPRSGGSSVEADARSLIIAAGLPAPNEQYHFDPARPRRRADLAWPQRGIRVLVEIDGGSWGTGRKCPLCKRSQTGAHTTGKGYERDRERDADAIILGWTVLRFTPTMVYDGRMVSILRKIIGSIMV